MYVCLTWGKITSPQKKTCSMKYILFITSGIIIANTMIHIHAMETLTENQKLLRSIKNELPADIQNIIIHMIPKIMAYDFFLGAKKETTCKQAIKLRTIRKPYARINRTVTFRTGIGFSPLYFKMPDQEPLELEYQDYSNFDHSERHKNEEILSCMKKTLTVAQANLILRVYHAKKYGNNFYIHALSEDGKIFLTFKEDIRIYLLHFFNIQLQIPSWLDTVHNWFTNITNPEKLLANVYQSDVLHF
jgi:hypothetical protein